MISLALTIVTMWLIIAFSGSAIGLLLGAFGRWMDERDARLAWSSP